jgi:arylsulfatase A-like enzyme
MASYGSLFTSRSPTVHRAGVQPPRAATFFSGQPLDQDAPLGPPEALAPDLPVLAEILRDHGWATAGFQWNPYLQGSSGLLRGFQRWVYYKWCADTAVDLALDWIGRRKGAPWFAFVHMVDPHRPYSAPPPFDRKYATIAPEDVQGYPPELDVTRREVTPPAMRKFFQDEYDGEIAWTDAQIGRLLDTLAASGDLDNTIILFHADHGEEFWDHGGYEHGHTVYQELLHVPLIFAYKGKIPAGVRVADRVGLIDVMPTVLDLLHLDAPKTLEGMSLVPFFRGQKLPPREFLSECVLYGDREMKALVVGNEKLILRAGDAPMPFDLVADPHELHDLAPSEPARADALRDKLLRRAKTLSAQAHVSHAREFSESEKADLNRLGY